MLVSLFGFWFEFLCPTNPHTACDKLQEGMVALVDMTSRPVAPLLRSLAGNAGIAYISMVDNSYYRNTWGDEALHWRVQPTAVQMLHVVADIVRKENLNNVALVYDDTFGEYVFVVILPLKHQYRLALK